MEILEPLLQTTRGAKTNYGELKQSRFSATHVDRKWPFCITGQQFFPYFLAIRLSKSKDT